MRRTTQARTTHATSGRRDAARRAGSHAVCRHRLPSVARCRRTATPAWEGRPGQCYTREQRQRYREKVTPCLDVFEQMLATSSFEFDKPMTGMEIELNLVDADYRPQLDNAEVLRRDRRPRVPDRAGAATTSSSTSPAASCSATRRSSSRASCATSLNEAERRRPSCGAHIVMIGILPTIMPEHFEGEWMSANTRYQALNDAVFAARGEDIYLDIEGPSGERLATYCRLARAGVGVHLDAAAPAGGAGGVRRALERRAGAGRAAAGARRRTPRTSIGKRAVGRDPHRAVHPGRRHPPGRAEEPGRAAPGVLRRALDHLDLRPVRGERALLPGDAARAVRRGPGGGARGRRRTRSWPRCGCTTARSTAGTGRSTTSSAVPRTCGSRTACCRPARPSSTSSPTRRSTTARCARWPTRTGRSGPG